MADGNPPPAMQAAVAAAERYAWSKLSTMQLGRYAEYFVKMEFALLGFDIYSPEVDERGIHFVLRTHEGDYYEIQVKSTRALNYIFVPKSKLKPSAKRLVAVVMFSERQPPDLYLVPSLSWESPDDLLVSRDFGDGKKSPPEWGINLSNKNLPLLQRFAFSEMAAKLWQETV